MRDFEMIMKDRGYWKDECWHGTKHDYTFETGCRMEFYSVDNYGKAHGPRRDVLFINEANNLAYNIVDQLITRTHEVVWLDWNPSEEFWFYTEMLNQRDDIDFITLTYKDNEALDESTIREIESHKGNKNWWIVYGLGQLGVVEGRIFKNWAIIDEVPHEARLERRGLDFGYSNDPTAIIDIYRFNSGYIFDEILYQKGLKNSQIADFLKKQEATVLTVADSSEPKSIDEIALHGVMISGAAKGKDSVNHGIQFIQDQRISVTKRSVNLIKEYRKYMWETDKNGTILNVPIDLWNHGMDACRYGMEGLRPLLTVDENKESDNERYDRYALI
jgi:phage terminase large subunit